MKKIILFDIDYTLFDTTKLKELVAEALPSMVPQGDIDFAKVDEIYYEVRQKGSFDPHLFATLFKEKFGTASSVEDIEHLWRDQHLIQMAIYPDVIPTLQKLQQKKDVLLGIFSSGNITFQKEKIASIYHFFTEEHMHFADFKDEILSQVFTTYKNDTVCLIDDFITFLQKAKSQKHDLFTIWMKRGKFALSAKIPDNFHPDTAVTTLAQIVQVLDDEWV